MSVTANRDGEYPEPTAPTELNPAPRPDECPTELSPGISAPLDAAAEPPLPNELSLPEAQSSVVAKVAKLLIDHGQDPRLAHPIHWRDGYLHQKFLASLQTKQQL